MSSQSKNSLDAKASGGKYKFDFVYSIFQKNNASFSLPRALSSLSCLGGGIIDAEGGDGRRRRNGGGTAERRGISWISQRVAVTVSVMGFGSVVESYSCANPISGLLRVYFSHTRRADRGNGEGFSIAGKQISPRDRYRSLLSRDKRSPRVPRIFHSLSLSFPPRSKSTIFARYLLLEIREYTYLPTPPPRSALSIFFAAAYFSSIYSDADRDGQRDDGSRRGCTVKGTRPFICVLPAG